MSLVCFHHTTLEPVGHRLTYYIFHKKHHQRIQYAPYSQGQMKKQNKKSKTIIFCIFMNRCSNIMVNRLNRLHFIAFTTSRISEKKQRIWLFYLFYSSSSCSDLHSVGLQLVSVSGGVCEYKACYSVWWEMTLSWLDTLKILKLCFRKQFGPLTLLSLTELQRG